jgi:MFS family permease
VGKAAGVLSSITFRRYFVGQSLSLLGDGLRTLAVPLLAYHLTHSALSTSAAFACEFGPFAVFSLVGGSLADRLDRRKLMIACDAIRFAVMAFLAVAYWLHFITLAMIYGGLIVISIAAAGFVSGQASSLVYVLGRERSTEAIAVLITAENASNLVTPVVGGALFAYFGPLPALTINALTYLAAQISIYLIPSLGPDSARGLPSLRHVAEDVALGYRRLWGDAGMRVQAFAGMTLNFFGFGAYAILIPFLKKDFGAGDQQVGTFLGISAMGAIAGATFAARNASRWPFGRALTIAYVLDAALFLPVVLVSNIWFAAVFWAASNAVANFEIAQIVGFRMRVTPEHMVGRVMGAVRLLVLSGMIPGVLLFGWFADHRNPRAAMWVACVGYIAIALAALVTPAVRDEVR